jgi:predicted RNase H-like HicB family nuclease
MSSYQFTIVVEKDEDGVYIASCPTLQGCYSQGDSYEEAVNNLKDAIHLHIEGRRQVGEPVPIEVAVDKVEISA